MSAAAYRELVAEKKKPVGSKRGTAPNPYAGLKCPGCGRLVRSTDPAEMRTEIGSDGRTLEVRARHLDCEARA
jgi:hypothetical protein